MRGSSPASSSIPSMILSGGTPPCSTGGYPPTPHGTMTGRGIDKKKAPTGGAFNANGFPRQSRSPRVQIHRTFRVVGQKFSGHPTSEAIGTGGNRSNGNRSDGGAITKPSVEGGSVQRSEAIDAGSKRHPTHTTKGTEDRSLQRAFGVPREFSKAGKRDTFRHEAHNFTTSGEVRTPTPTGRNRRNRRNGTRNRGSLKGSGDEEKAESNPTGNLASVDRTRVLPKLHRSMTGEGGGIDGIVPIKPSRRPAHRGGVSVTLDGSDYAFIKTTCPTAIATAGGHEVVDLSLKGRIPAQDAPDLQRRKVARINVDVQPAGTVNRRTAGG